MKFQKTSRPIKLGTLVVLATILIFSGCQKRTGESESRNNYSTSENSTSKENQKPYSLRNVQKAQELITARSTKQNSVTQQRANSQGLQEFIYFKFDPNQLSQELFEALENDSSNT